MRWLGADGMSANCPAALVTNILGDEPQPPGAIQFDADYRSLLFVCPCGCGVLGALPFRPYPDGPSWEWDGNREKPTLMPSVQKTSPCRWHGWLRAGEWVSC